MPASCPGISVELLAGLLSNSDRTPLRRALDAYRKLDLSQSSKPQSRLRMVRQAKFLTVSERARLVAHYESGARIRDLAHEFGIDRRTVSHHLRQHGVSLRPHTPTEALIREMVRLYESGLSLAAVSDQVGCSPYLVQRYLREQEVVIRPKTRRKKP